MEATINKAGQPAETGLAHSTINEGSLLRPTQQASANPMHAQSRHDRGMERALRATRAEDRAAIVHAVLDGLDAVDARRAEDALALADFAWPVSAPPRCLGGIMSHLARLGMIREVSWTKGRHGRSRAGRVSLWVKVVPS